ncbi:hypothetical protein GCM10010199_44710 [Dactylosporangium roseum]
MNRTMRRDAWGVPHLWADTVDELAFLQGQVTATDRRGQLDAEHRRAEGRLAAIAGPAEVPWDRFARRARLDDTARRCHETLDARTRRWIASYVDGVNSTGLRFRPWTPLGIFLVQHILFGTFPNKLWHAHVEATLGPEAVDLFAVEGPGGSGSNAWYDASRRVLAGDPHRLLELPGIYQQIQLACPAFDVVGLAFPGVPGVQHFGQTRGVAWAVTNAMADYQDLFREQLRRVDGRVLVRDPGGWTPVPAWTETIEVHGAPDEQTEIVETARGPIVDVDRNTGEGLSLRTPARVESRLGFEALLPLLCSSTVDDVAAALTSWVEPVNSVLVADTTGAVLRLVAGLVPVRDDRNRRGPVPAWDPAHEWRPGYAPLPRVTETGSVVTANDRRPDDVAALGADFAPPFRAERIRTLLAEGAPPEAIHRDTLVDTALLRLLDGTAAGARLSGWDGRMDADSTAAGTFAAWRTALAGRLYDHPRLRPLQAARGYDELFTPWTDPRARIGHALDGVALGLHRLGVDVPSLATAAFEDVAASGSGPWGERHLLAPVELSPAWDTRVPLGGDTGALLCTSNVPGVSDACWRGPVARYVWDLTDRSRSRWIVPFGASDRAEDPHFADQLPLWADGRLVPATPFGEHVYVYEEKIPDIGLFRLEVLRPAEHAELVHGWVTERRAAFWGMGGHSVDDVREIYEFVDSLPTHHAFLMLLDGRPIGLFQTYEPDADPVGERYPVQPGDHGMHLLLAPGRHRPRGLTDAVGPALARYIFRDPEHRRIVVEPDVRNHFALRRLKLEGFVLSNEIDMPDKRAVLAFLTRAAFFTLNP